MSQEVNNQNLQDLKNASQKLQPVSNLNNLDQALNSKDAKTFTLGVKELVKKEGFNPEGPNNIFNTVSTSGVLGKRYKDTGLDSTLLDRSELEYRAALNQSVASKLGNTALGFGVNAYAGALDWFGSSYDAKGIYNMAAGRHEDELGNFITNYTSELRKDVQDDFPIYQTGSMMTQNYWLNQIQSLGYSAGLVIGGLADQLALAAVTGGIGNIATAGVKAKGAWTLGRSAFQGMRSGLGEAYINGLETAHDVKETALRNGKTEEEANQLASEAATMAYRLEALPLMALNALQYTMFIGKPGTAFNRIRETPGFGVSDNVGKMLEGVAGMNKFSKWGVNALSEAAEEVYQDGISNYAKGEDFWQRELIDSAIGGALGSVLLPGIGKAFQRVTQGADRSKEYEKLLDKSYEKFMEDTMNLTSKITGEKHALSVAYAQAELDYNNNPTPENRNKLSELARQIKETNYNAYVAHTLQALDLSYRKGDLNAFNSHIEQMQELLEAANNPTEHKELLQSLGIFDENGKEKYEGTLANIRNTFEDNIKSSIEIKNVLEDTLNNVTSDFNIAKEITYLKLKNQNSLNTLSEYENAQKLLLTNDKNFNKLSPEGQNRFRLESEKLTNEKLGLDNTDVNARLAELEDYSRADSLLIPNIETNAYINSAISIKSLEKSIEETNKKLQEFTPEGIAKKINKEKEDRIKLAKNLEEAKRLAEKAKKEQDKKNAKLAKEKVQKLAVQEKAEKLVPKVEYNGNPNTSVEEGSIAPNENDKKTVSLFEMMNSGTLNQENNNDLEEQMFSPRDLNESAIPEDIKNQIREVTDITAKELDNKLGREAQFEDYVRNFIEKTSFDKVDDLYNTLKHAWNLIGRDISNADAVYNKFYNSEAIHENLYEAYLGNSNTETTLAEVTSKDSQFTNPVDYDYNNRPIQSNVVIDPTVTNNPSAKISFLGVEYKEVYNPEKKRHEKKSLPQLASTFDNNFILNPEYNKVGTTFTVEVLKGTELDESITSVWEFNPSKNRLESKTVKFKDLGLKPGSSEFIAKVPMVVKDAQGNTVAFLHTTDWYNPNNIQGYPGVSTEENINKAIKELYAIRKSIFEGNNSITITDRKFGSLHKIEEEFNSSRDRMPISEATGETKLAIATSQSELMDYTKNSLTGSYEFVNDFEKNPLHKGLTYDIRHVGTKQDGTKQYIALPAFSNIPQKGQTLNDTAFNNIKYSVIASLMLNNQNNTELIEGMSAKYNMTLSKAEDIREAILKSSGGARIDIRTNIGDYIKHFVPVETRNNSFHNIIDDKNQSPIGSTYSVFDNNILKFHKKDGNPIEMNDRGYPNIKGLTFNPNSNLTFKIVGDILDTYFDENTGIVRDMPQVTRLDSLGRNNSFVSIDNNGNVSEYKSSNGESSYDAYLKDTYTTNVKSFKTQDKEGKDVWITDVQPMIYYGLSDVNITTNTTNNEDVVEAQEQVEKEKQTEIDSLKTVFDNDTATEIADMLEDLGLDDIFESRRNFSLEESEVLDNLGVARVSTLTALEQTKLVDSLFNSVLSKINISNHKISMNEVSSLINDSIDKDINNKIKELNAYIEKIREKASDDKNLMGVTQKLSTIVRKLEGVVNEKNILISFGENGQNKGIVVNKLEKFFTEELDNIESLDNTSEDIIEDNNGEVENSYDSSSFERDTKLSFSTSLKVFFAGIERIDTNGKVDKNFSGLPNYVSTEQAVMSLLEQTTGLPSSIEDLKNILEKRKEDKPILGHILNRINNASESLQNEILYKLIKSKLDMHMVMYEHQPGTAETSERYNLTIYNANSTNQDIKMMREWISNFKNSDLLDTKDEKRVYNIDNMEMLISNIKTLATLEKNSAEALDKAREIFKSLGIDIKDNTINMYIKGDNNGAGSKTFLGDLAKTIQGIIKESNNKGETYVDFDGTGNNPYRNLTSYIKDLIDIDVEMNGTKVSKSFRVAGKTIQGTVQKMMGFDIADKLVDTNSELFKSLKEIPYSKDNFILDFIERDNKFKNSFGVSFVSLEAIKELKKKSFGDKKINKVPESDAILAQLGFFQNTFKTLSIEHPRFNTLKFRMAKMFNPTLSDKEQMLLFDTAVLDINSLDFKNGEVRNGFDINGDVIAFTTEQIFEAEFNRIVSIVKNKTNIKNYDNAAKRFLTIPALNEMSTVYEGVETNILDLINQAVKNDNSTDASAVRKLFLGNARQVVSDYIESEVNKKLSIDKDGNISGTWVDNKFFEKNDKGEIRTQHFDSLYTRNKQNNNKDIVSDRLAKLTTYDFVVNNLIHQNNVFQLFAGDMALYAGNIKKATKNGVVDNVAFSKQVGESITKRMAMMIAPGNKLANSKNDKYLQIFMNDPVTSTSTARQFMEQYYGEVTKSNEELLTRLEAAEKDLVELYRNEFNTEDFQEKLDTIEDNINSIRKELKNANTEIAGYFEIEGTDAQEYTTWKEHMDVLFRQGRLSVSDKALLASAYRKLERGEDINKDELRVVMNPIKPVYAGNNIFKDKEGNPLVNRIVYIKSSSFPLLPQLTRDFKLDKVREHMEALQAKTGKNVRMSYQTANKVGAVASKIDINHLYEQGFDSLYSVDKDTGTVSGILNDAILELDRDNFKVQQDTPYKTAKFLERNSEDMTTMGSQIWKLLLGNNINKIDRDIFPNIFDENFLKEIGITKTGNLNGFDIDNIKFQAEKMYIERQKNLLYSELKLNENGRPNNYLEFKEALRDLLIREVSTRQYPENMIDSLELIVENEDNPEFLTPLWISTNSDKFESLLQSIITSRLIRIKLPGNQHISASSEGFVKVSSDEVLNNKTKEGIVWIDPNHNGELKSTRIEGTNLIESEVLVQSKFRRTYKDENGKLVTKLIDLTDEKYSEVRDGFRYLKLDMIDEDLLKNFSFRIPTSSHQSGAILKVVGFLPEQSGDMVVVPKEHTQQIGEDFDVDKRTLYKNNYTIDKTGAIRKLSYSNLNAKAEQEGVTLTDRERNNNYKKELQMLENIMVDVYKSVYMSPDKEVQNKVNKILSFDNASNTANLIYNKKNSNQDEKLFSILSDDYQRAQMKLGADGKIGIGAHSNAVTLQSLLERLKEPVTIMEAEVNEEGKTIYVPSHMRIGNFVSDGTLGNIATLDGERNIGDIHTENQNSATDNIKAQIMGKRNENAYTMNVLIQLAYRGFDMDNFTRVPGIDKVQIGSLFIAQPILVRYVELMEANKSLTSEFTASAEADVLKKLVEEFDPNGTTGAEVYIDENGTPSIVSNKSNAYHKLTGDNLYDNLIAKDSSPEIQMTVFNLFNKLQAEARDIGKVQKLINLHSSGLGISYFNTLNRLKSFKEVTSGMPTLKNVNNLIGEIKEESGEFEPTTIEGYMLMESLRASTNIVGGIFPYNKGIILDTVNDILANRGEETTVTPSKELALQYEVVKSLKDFINSSNLGLFNGDINTERERLFFDRFYTDGTRKRSLASYLSHLKHEGGPRVKALFENNQLLKSLNLDRINYTGKASVITHQVDSSSAFDRSDKYTAFLELIQDDKTALLDFNGEKMTPRKLAQDLASYAFLSNEENGAIGFREFVHMDYLKAIGYTDSLRKNTTEILGDTNFKEVFLKQFYQHNPAEAVTYKYDKFPFETITGTNKEAEQSLKLLTEGVNSLSLFVNKADYFFVEIEDAISIGKYISFKVDNKNLTDNTYELFKYDSQLEAYVKIPTLGDYGYNEYNPNVLDQVSNIYKSNNSLDAAKKADENIVKDVKEDNGLLNEYETIFGSNTSIEGILDTILKSDNEVYKELAKSLKPFINVNTKVVLGDIKAGSYSPSTNTITLNKSKFGDIAKSDVLSNNTVVQEVALEEVIHSMTVDLLSKYGDVKSKDYNMSEDAPLVIKRLNDLYEIAKLELPNEYYTSNIGEFVAGALVSEDFKNKLNNIDVKGTPLFQKIKQALANVISYVTGTTYSSAVNKEVMELIKLRKPQTVNSTKAASSVNPIEEMKKRDAIIQQELNSTVSPRPTISSTLPLGTLNIIKASKYNASNDKRLLEGFKQGRYVATSSPAERVKYPDEYKYMESLNNYVKSILPAGGKITDVIEITKLDNGDVLVRLKEVKPLEMSNLTEKDLINSIPQILANPKLYDNFIQDLVDNNVITKDC